MKTATDYASEDCISLIQTWEQTCFKAMKDPALESDLSQL